MDENGKWVTIAWINFFGGIFFFFLFGYSAVAGFVDVPTVYHDKDGVALTPCTQEQYSFSKQVTK